MVYCVYTDGQKWNVIHLKINLYFNKVCKKWLYVKKKKKKKRCKEKWLFKAGEAAVWNKWSQTESHDIYPDIKQHTISPQSLMPGFSLNETACAKIPGYLQ